MLHLKSIFTSLVCLFLHLACTQDPRSEQGSQIFQADPKLIEDEIKALTETSLKRQEMQVGPERL